LVLVNNLAMAACGGRDDVSIGGMSAFHQFVRIGAHAFMADTAASSGCSSLSAGAGVEDSVHGPNSIGLRRKDFPASDSGLKETVRLFSGTLRSGGFGRAVPNTPKFRSDENGRIHPGSERGECR
jgi:acyl-[acyl carrier protein]--UDP-N-acetylglucosamine O-acyltransferase